MTFEEAVWGAGWDRHSLHYVAIGTDIGVGIIPDGKLCHDGLTEVLYQFD